MHPEVEELIKKKGWKPSQAAVFEDIKRAFPDMSLNDAMNLVLQYYFPQKEIRKNGAIIEHRLTDVRTGKERVLTLEEMIKARSIVRKHKLGNRDYQDAAAVRYDEKVIEVIRGLEGKLEELSHEKDEIKESKQNHECGILAEGYNDFQEGDKIECYEITQKMRTIE